MYLLMLSPAASWLWGRFLFHSSQVDESLPHLQKHLRFALQLCRNLFLPPDSASGQYGACDLLYPETYGGISFKETKYTWFFVMRNVRKCPFRECCVCNVQGTHAVNTYNIHLFCPGLGAAAEKDLNFRLCRQTTPCMWTPALLSFPNPHLHLN
jgi:hypothetical protein